MSYARLGPDSDVYFYVTDLGRFECCWCRLHGRAVVTVEGHDAALEHLQRHLDAVHKVPAEAIERLTAEMMDDWTTEARARCEAATPGPWDDVISSWHVRTLREGVDFICEMVDADDGTSGPFGNPGPQTSANKAFIAAARADLPRALAVVEAADALVAALATADLECIYKGSAAARDKYPECPAPQKCWTCQMRPALTAYRKVRR